MPHHNTTEISQFSFNKNKIQDPFGKQAQIQLERGASGAARLRRIPLFTTHAYAYAIDTHGSIADLAHLDYAASAATTIKFFLPFIMPIDYVEGGEFPTINYRFSSSTTTGNVVWIVRVDSIGDEATAQTSLLDDTTAVAVPSVANTVDTRTVSLTTRPQINDTINLELTRDDTSGSDTNAGTLSIWSVWLEYLAFF